jgi:hypothetical protein
VTGEPSSAAAVRFIVQRALGPEAADVVNPSPFDLTVEILEVGGDFLGKAEYRTGVDVDIVRGVVAALSRAVRAACERSAT